MMDCRNISELMVEYLYQELDPAQLENFESHLQTCSKCAGELSAYERTRVMMREISDQEPPTRISAFLLQQANSAMEPSTVGFWQRLHESLRMVVLHPAMTAAATLVVVLGISFYVYRNGTPPTQPVGYEQLSTEIDRPQGSTATLTVPKESATEPVAITPNKGESNLAYKTEQTPEPQRAKMPAPPANDQVKRVTLAEGDRRSQPTETEQRSSRLIPRDKELANASSGYYPSRAKNRSAKPTVLAKSPPPDSDQKDEQGSSLNLPSTAASAFSRKSQVLGNASESLATKSGPTPPAASAPKQEASLRGDLAGGAAQAAPAKPAPKVAPLYQQKDGKMLEEQGAPLAQQKASFDDLAVSGGSSGKKNRARQGPSPSEIKQALTAIERGDKAAAAGHCMEALQLYQEAVRQAPHLLESLTSKVQNCASLLARSDERNLIKAQKVYPAFSRIFALEQVKEQQARTSAAAKSKKAAPAKNSKANAQTRQNSLK
jgi:hypothetical protein